MTAPAALLKSRLILLTGDEEALRRRALGDLLQAAEITPDDFDYQSLVGDATPPMEWIASASTLPFLGERRVVVVRNALRADVKEFAAAAPRSLPPSALLILVADDESGSEERLRKLGTNRTALAKLVKDAGGAIEEFKVDPKAAKGALILELSRLGRKMSPRGIETLLEMCGGSVSRAIDELEKIVLFTEFDPIPESAVAAVAVASPEWSIWKLVDAVASGNGGGALAQLRKLLGSGKKAESAALEQILPMLGRQFRLLYQARLVMDHGRERASAGFPEKPNFAKEAPYRQSSIEATARNLTLIQISGCLRALSDADAGIKGMIDSYSGAETLETMVLRMCAIVRPSVASTV